MPWFAKVSGDFMVCSEMCECGKSEQNLASYYYLLVVKLVVKRIFLLLRVLSNRCGFLIIFSTIYKKNRFINHIFISGTFNYITCKDFFLLSKKEYNYQTAFGTICRFINFYLSKYMIQAIITCQFKFYDILIILSLRNYKISLSSSIIWLWIYFKCCINPNKSEKSL